MTNKNVVLANSTLTRVGVLRKALFLNALGVLGVPGVFGNVFSSTLRSSELFVRSISDWYVYRLNKLIEQKRNKEQ
jgi:hypothetical protein